LSQDLGLESGSIGISFHLDVVHVDITNYWTR